MLLWDSIASHLQRAILSDRARGTRNPIPQTGPAVIARAMKIAPKYGLE